MNPVTRGARNAFRNATRTVSIIIILGLSIGLCLTMLIAHTAVNNKIASVKGSIGNTISISAAGVQGFQGGGNPLNQASVSKLSTIDHVTQVSELVNDQLRSSSRTTPNGTTENANTNLVSAIDAGSLGQRFGGFSTSTNAPSAAAGVATGDGGASFSFTPPVSAYGTTDPTKLNGSTITLKSGTTIQGTTDKPVAVIGTTLATKNNLTVGSTFTAYDTTITVAGIFDAGTTFGNNSVIFSLPTLQRLSSQTGNLTSAVVTVDSITNMDKVTASVKSSLGSSADVTSSKDTAATALAPLDSVKTIAVYSLIGAIVAGAVIILLTMVMVVRERKREIGVVKAIGGSNIKIMLEFMIESLTLALLGAIVGLIIGVVGGQPVTKLLVNNSTSNTTPTISIQGPGNFQRSSGSGATTVTTTGPAGGGFGRGFRNNSAVRGITNIKTQIGWAVLAEGFGAALIIALIGSSLAAGLIAKVRPNEVMRSL